MEEKFLLKNTTYFCIFKQMSEFFYYYLLSTCIYFRFVVRTSQCYTSTQSLPAERRIAAIAAPASILLVPSPLPTGKLLQVCSSKPPPYLSFSCSAKLWLDGRVIRLKQKQAFNRAPKNKIETLKVMQRQTQLLPKDKNLQKSRFSADRQADRHIMHHFSGAPRGAFQQPVYNKCKVRWLRVLARPLQAVQNVSFLSETLSCALS